MAQFENDLTGGSVSKNLIRFSMPFLLSNFIQAMYNVADMLVVSWYSGPNGVSGVANGGQITILVTNFIVGLTVGGTVLIGQYYGAKRHEDMKRTIGTMLSVLIILAVILTVGMIALCDPILRTIRMPQEAFSEARSYLNICMSGTVFIFGYNAISAILRGMGDSKRPLYFVTIACFVNIGLDFVFVGGMKMGAAGAALATIIAQAVSLILSVVYLARNKFIFDFKLKSFRIDPAKLRLLIKIGIPSSVQNVIVGLSFLILTALVNGFGVHASAAQGIVSKYNGFAILPAIAMSASVSSMAAQNIGAGRMDRAIETMKCGIKIVYPITALFFILCWIAPEGIMRIFTDDAEVIASGIQYMRFYSFDYLVVPVLFTMNGLIMGAGKTLFTMVNGMFSSIFLRMPMAYLFGIVLNMGIAGIALGGPAASFGGMITVTLYYKSKRWMKNRVPIATQTPQAE